MSDVDDSSVKAVTKFGENNENDEIRSPKLQKPKKGVMKHFMEPTISAATKAALLPKRKILAERNEAFTFINSAKPSILDSRASPARSLRSSCTSDGEDEDNIFDGDSSLKKPYDPFTNYLSPRPKFLRYNPNKKRRIVLHGEGEINEKKDGLGVVSTGDSFESKEGVEGKGFEEGFEKEEDVGEGRPNDLDNEDAEMEKDIEECDDDEEEEEEEEEEVENCWSLLGLLKFLLVLGSLFLSTSYICSMNSDDYSLIEQAIREFRYGFLDRINTREVFTRNEHLASDFEVLGGVEEESLINLPDVRQEDIDIEFVEVEASEVKIEKPENVYDDGLMKASDALQSEEAMESETNSDVAEASSDQLSEDIPARDQEMGEIQDRLDQLQRAVKDLFSEANPDFYADFEQIESEEIKSQLEAAESSPDQLSENLSARDQEMGGIQDGLDHLQRTETAEVKDLFLETEASDVNAEFEQRSDYEVKSQVEVAALVVLFAIVPALGLFYHSRRRNSKKASLPTQKNSEEAASLPIETHQPDTEPAHQIQNTNEICSVEEEYVEKAASFTSPSTPLLASMNEVPEEFSSRQRQAPIVELLGELVIGEETFARSSKMTRMPDPEERNASNSLSAQMMKSRSKTSLVQNQVYPTHLELSTADSTSQKKKRPVKEENKGEEVSMSTMTPVRRSSRIRNKAMSP